ncbi:YmfQ family protein [Cohnella zeiphila]|uniref:YmfQ family protein n=1 Tax=Cohnella zeiphila TaxID=2761120 RepID=A0A7X0SHG8_9BACL|nr:YmfQ family protein [Cohnella zeiphila]MBB6730062.1 YmfQ family protein [Cohnella zeiphila]
MIELPMTSSAGQRMLTYLPGYYATSKVIRSMMDAEGQELDQLQAALDDILNQFFVSSATWGLNRWEAELAIPIDESKPIDQRRSAIVSKIRGTGTVTVQLLQKVAQSFENGSIQVTQQPELYQFTVKFVDTLGLPPNIDDIKAAIEEIKPAHLEVQYAFRYLTVGEVSTMTIDQLQTHPLTDFAPFLDA